jgi:hypothetical protein
LGFVEALVTGYGFGLLNHFLTNGLLQSFFDSEFFGNHIGVYFSIGHLVYFFVYCSLRNFVLHALLHINLVHGKVGAGHTTHTALCFGFLELVFDLRMICE